MTHTSRAGSRSTLPRGPGPLLPFLPPIEPRRFVVLHFPDLACELAIFERESRVGVVGALGLDRPVAAVLLDEGQALLPTMPLHSAAASAARAGVRPGQTVADARRLVPDLDVRGVFRESLARSLRCFAEAVRDAGAVQRLIPPDSLSLGLDTIDRDEGPLMVRLSERLRMLGHRVRAAAADHEATALLLARYSPDPRCVVGHGREAEALAPFPPEVLQRAEAALRHHPIDETSLGPMLTEEVRWATPVAGSEPLSHALYWLANRLSARLQGRRQESALARLRWQSGAGEARLLSPTITVPVRRSADLIRLLSAGLPALAARGDAVSLALELADLRSLHDDGPASSGGSVPVQVLAAELGAELGPGRVGVLSASDGALLPRLGEPVTLQTSLLPPDALTPPTRVLDVPAPVTGKLARGARVEIDQQTFVVQRVTPVDPGVPSQTQEHLVVWLSHGDSGALSWIVRDRRQKRAFLHGWFT